MLLKVRTIGESQRKDTEMSMPVHSPQPITGGQGAIAEMLSRIRPQLFTWCRTRSAEMPTCWRTKGKGQVNIAEIPTLLHPSQPITGGHRQNAEMPLCYRPHQFTRCQIVHAEMLLKVRTKGKGQRHNTEMSIDCRPSQPITGGHLHAAAMPTDARPTKFGPYTACRNAKRRPPK